MIKINNSKIASKFNSFINLATPLVRGIVVDTKDEYNIGRVRIRILNLHGTDSTGIPDNQLPWAFPCNLFSSHDSGTYLIPDVGSTVWILFEEGDPDKPVYIGGSYGVGISLPRELGKTDLYTRDQPIADSEVPKNVIDEDTYVLFKSPSGKAIIFSDSDNDDAVILRDHLGQVISMESTLTKDFKGSYVYKEFYEKDMRDTKFLDWEGLVGYAKLTIKSLSHSLLSFISNATRSIVTLKSKSDDRESTITLHSGDTNKIELSVGNTSLVIDEVGVKVVKGSVSYYLEDR